MGSSPSKNAENAASKAVPRLTHAKLLKQLEHNQREIQELKDKVEAQDLELQIYKKLLRLTGGPTHVGPPTQEESEDKSEESGSDDESDDTQQPYENLPKVGDHVISMWSECKWQYFTATVVSFDSSTLKYTVEWDDGDPTGRVVDYYNLAKDEVPSEDEIGVGSIVLFHQGRYPRAPVNGASVSEELRWHQGEITKVYEDASGAMKYEGKHTKAASDGKWVTYGGYSEKFRDYRLEEFRLPPNVFDVLDSMEEPGAGHGTKASENENDEIDVFISYAVINSPSAIKNKEVNLNELPASYEEVSIENMCDPRDIVSYLRDMGVKVYFTEKDDDSSLLEIAQILKRAKVFVACLSDEYASNDRCRMEFQYAKKTTSIPVIPIVVGTGSFQWKMTVVGMLIAGELYIHFQDKSVQKSKMNELVRSIKRYIPDLELNNLDPRDNKNITSPGDLVAIQRLRLLAAGFQMRKSEVFFSYCWSNSYNALKSNQISDFVGNEWNDPRMIADRLTRATHSVLWIDFKRLESAADGIGMFEQISEAINDSKIVVACISNEYAQSNNCRMELQFAAMSMKKPLIILIVGKGSHWKQTAIGKVEQMAEATIDMQNVTNEEQLDESIRMITDKMMKMDGFSNDDPEKVLSLLQHGPGQQKFKAPKIGDQVICLRQKWEYFTATVVKFDPTDLVYTVDWDDGELNGRVQSYANIALNAVPESSEVGIGSNILFPQGSYESSEENSACCFRYHQGMITGIRENSDGVTKYDGEHTKGVEDGKSITFHGYSFQFVGYTLAMLRISPNAMDALLASKQAFHLE